MTPEKVLIRKILLAHGARPDLRLFRNESGVFWAGIPQGRTPAGELILARPSRVTAGLATGSGDLIGIREGGQFLSVEVKAGRTRTEEEQELWLEMVLKFGGVAGIVKSVEDVTAMLGPAPRMAK